MKEGNSWYEHTVVVCVYWVPVYSTRPKVTPVGDNKYEIPSSMLNPDTIHHVVACPAKNPRSVSEVSCTPIKCLILTSVLLCTGHFEWAYLVLNGSTQEWQSVKPSVMYQSVSSVLLLYSGGPKTAEFHYFTCTPCQGSGAQTGS